MFSKKSSSAKSKSDVKNIVTINAYAEKYYIYKDEILKPLNRLSFNKSNFNVSYLANKDIISTVVYLSRSIPDEDISDILDIKAYEELGLDQASNYIISYIEIPTVDKEREFHIFVADPDTLTSLYEPIKEKTKFIDLIVPTPLLYKALYTDEILTDTNVHCFMYFSKEDAFITIYKDGEYLYSKSIDFSLDQIYEKYCEILGEKVDEKKFFDSLEKEGLKASVKESQDALMKIFGEVFISVNDVIIYVKRAFKLETIDQMFIGSSQGPIMGLDEYSQNYLGLPSSDFNFTYQIKTDEWYVDQMHFLMLMTALHYNEDENYTVNLTMFPRPPSFVNRASGQFIITTFAAISLALAYPLVYLVGSYVNDAKIYSLSKENDKLSKEANKYKQILKQKKEKIKYLDNELKNLTNTYEGKRKTLESIYDKKVNYRLKSGIYYKLAEELNKFDVHVDGIQTNNNTVWISMVSSDDRKLTELIAYISHNDFDEIDEIDIERIQKNPQSKYYKGLLKVKLR